MNDLMAKLPAEKNARMCREWHGRAMGRRVPVRMGAIALASWFLLSPGLAPAASAAPDWRQALDQAVKRARLETADRADQNRAAAEKARAEGWLAGAPSLEGLYRNDRPITNRGEVEMELGLNLPLRRPGQTEAWKMLAGRWAGNAQARAQALRLGVAGRLRAAAWRWREVEAALAETTLRFKQVQRDMTIVKRQIRLGESAGVDRLAVEARLLDIRQRLAERHQALTAAQAHWHWLTGLNRLPSDLDETPRLPVGPVTASYLLKTHPVLRQLATRVDLDAAQLAAERAAGAGTPELGLAVKRDRGDRATPYDNSLMLTFSVPFGGQRYRDPKLAALSQQRAQRQVEMVRTATRLQARVSLLRARVSGWPERLKQLTRRADLKRRQLVLMRKAQRLGEIDWSRLLTFERQAAEARLQAGLAKVSYLRDRADLAQALGELPGSEDQHLGGSR